jgi:gliding motility-associated lipoprotein GldD
MPGKTTINIVICGVVLLFFFSACKRNYTPKPRGYFRIDLPEKGYKIYQSNCPYKFEYPVYGTIRTDNSYNSEPCWINIEFPAYNAKIHISYKPVYNNIALLLEDSHALAYKHTIKAQEIQEKLFTYEKRKVYGMIYEIKGNAASSVQFFLTDSTSHYLRGALYFNLQPNADSLAPVIHFFKEDIIHLIETLEWED